MTWLIITIAVLGVIIFFIFLKKKQDELEESFLKRFTGKNIRMMDKYALYVAKESDGHSHFRGSGYLVLTGDELYFERQMDGKIIMIPLSSIIKVDRTRRLGGQSPGKLMLKVEFKTQEGAEDAIAWKVRELEEWIKQITRMAINHS